MSAVPPPGSGQPVPPAPPAKSTPDKVWDAILAKIVGVVIAGALGAIAFVALTARGEIVAFAKARATDEMARALASEPAFVEKFRTAADHLIIPVGTVVAWPGDLPGKDDPWHNHWRLCDGTPVKVTGRDDPLYVVLGRRYGDADVDHVRLPNYQGYFLRGLDTTGNIDFDRAPGEDEDTFEKRKIRLAKPDTPGTPRVLGSIQFWATGTPNPLQHATTVREADGGLPYLLQWEKQTRPTNTTVHWIIRIK